MPAVLETLEHDSGDIKVLWSQSIYRYVIPYIVDNAGRHDVGFAGRHDIDFAGRHDIDFGREELINGLSFFS